MIPRAGETEVSKTLQAVFQTEMDVHYLEKINDRGPAGCLQDRPRINRNIQLQLMTATKHYGNCAHSQVPLNGYLSCQKSS